MAITQFVDYRLPVIRIGGGEDRFRPLFHVLALYVIIFESQRNSS